jgi:hypothetical protein
LRRPQQVPGRLQRKKEQASACGRGAGKQGEHNEEGPRAPHLPRPLEEVEAIRRAVSIVRFLRGLLPERRRGFVQFVRRSEWVRFLRGRRIQSESIVFVGRVGHG